MFSEFPHAYIGKDKKEGRKGKEGKEGEDI